MDNPYKEVKIYSNVTELKCLFDCNDICIGFNVNNKNYFNTPFDETHVIGTGIYMIPDHIGPIGRIAEDLIKYGKKVSK